MSQQIILASTSPRRAQLLKLLNLEFKVVDSGYEEVLRQDVSAKKLVQFLALGKAKAAAKKYRNAIIIAADTVVYFKGKAIGKPKSRQDAEAMLKSFSGKKQSIFSGLAIHSAKTKQVFTAVDEVIIYFKKLSQNEIKNYVAAGEPMDRAGAYAFQGLGFNLIKKMQGDVTTAIGMPMTLVYNGLKKFGVKLG